MPKRDYVKTARPQAKSRKKAPAKAPFPWLVLSVTAGLVFVFGWFLWTINQQEPVATKPQPAAVVKDELPERPTEEPYQYIRELENREVVVEVRELESRGPFQMQCASFRSEQQADAMRAQIAFAGFSSTIRRTEGSNGVWYRVVLGPYDSRRQAEADRNRLRRNGINSCQIWNWN
ncbi:SPOR domain-containing protein [Alkalimonas sp. MEB108]|uniref:SPOR domain-containing protein n=1 Tax=Alkalimonas cellulosilytica TaxID=3058395 RepID=A0ABU7J617_9GAMM|nr:SPOR domain-containing protein [Alkalimonas sp. MEB108]MEE2001964.1 SPOR domain-containing protein [Alkalimonas sp. MEB108]